jgi:hypothetical protein
MSAFMEEEDKVRTKRMRVRAREGSWAREEERDLKRPDRRLSTLQANPGLHGEEGDRRRRWEWAGGLALESRSRAPRPDPAKRLPSLFSALPCACVCRHRRWRCWNGCWAGLRVVCVVCGWCVLALPHHS